MDIIYARMHKWQKDTTVKTFSGESWTSSAIIADQGFLKIPQKLSLQGNIIYQTLKYGVICTPLEKNFLKERASF